MTFTEWLNKYEIFAWLILAIVIMFVIGFLVKFFINKSKDKQFRREITPKVSPDIEAILASLNKPKKAVVKLRPEKKVKVVKKKEEPVVLQDTKSIPYQVKKPKLSFGFWKDWIYDKYFPGKLALIYMELSNGFFRMFKVSEKEEGFIFRGKKYLFDDESKYYNIDARLYTFDYHEGIALPIKRKIPSTQIKKTLESTEGMDIEYAINPATLQRFMTAKIAEGVMKGTQLDEFMRKLQMFLLVTMIASLVHLALFLYASGILQNLSVPSIIG